MGQLRLITSFSFPPILTPLSFAFALIELVSLCLRGLSSQVAELLLRSLAGSHPALWDFVGASALPLDSICSWWESWNKCGGHPLMRGPSLAPAEDQGAFPSSRLKQNLIIPAPVAPANFPQPPPLPPVCSSSSKHDDVGTAEAQQTECQVACISVRGSECNTVF